jgi:hypothetical protein
MANELKFGNKVVFLNGNPITLPVRASDPGSAIAGDMYYNSVSNMPKYYNGTSWVSMSSGLEGQALNDGQIIIGNGSNLSEAVSVTGDVVISNSGVTSISAGAIVDADINASAAIAYSKLNIADGDLSIAKTSGLQAALDGKVDENAPIVGDTKTKITYDAKGLVTAGADLEASDMPSGIDAAKIADGSVSNAEFQYLDGVTSSIQTQLDGKAASSHTHAISDVTGLQTALDGKIDDSEKGANNGVATLDAGGKIPVSQLPSSVMEYKGNWDASTNSPSLADGVGDAGDVYRVNVAGTQNLGSGNQTFAIGDWVVYNGSIWQLSSNSNAVMSVNGQTGVVVLDSDDINEGVTNLYFSDEKAQDAVGAMVDDSSKISLTYDDGVPSLVADIVPGSLVDADISASAAIAYSKLNILDGDLTIAKTSGLQAALDGKVDENAPIVGETKTKITYDAKGLVTAGADLEASDIPSGIDAAKIANGSVSNAEFQYLDGVTSGIQGQLDGKAAASHTHVAADITDFNSAAKAATVADAIADGVVDVAPSQNAVFDALALKANDADVIKKDGSVDFTADQSMGDNDLVDVGNLVSSNPLGIVAPKARRSQDGVNFIEEQYIDSVTLTGSSTVNVVSYPSASYVGAHIEYVIKSNAGEIRTGKVYIANKPDGSSVSMSDMFSETADCDVVLSADFASPDVRLRATESSGSNGTMRLDVKLIRA